MATTKKKTTSKKTVIKKVETKTVELAPPEMRTLAIHIRSMPGSALLMNNFSKEKMAAMIDKMKSNGQSAAKKKPLDERASYLESFSMIRGEPETRSAVYGILARAMKQTIVNAAPFCGSAVSKTRLKGSLFIVHAESGPYEPMIRLLNHSAPRMHFAIARTKDMSKKPLPTYRALFDEWEMKFKVRFDASTLSMDHVIAVIARAGLHVGICDWSPRLGGDFGMFELVSAG